MSEKNEIVVEFKNLQTHLDVILVTHEISKKIKKKAEEINQDLTQDIISWEIALQKYKKEIMFPLFQIKKSLDDKIPVLQKKTLGKNEVENEVFPLTKGIEKSLRNISYVCRSTTLTFHVF